MKPVTANDPPRRSLVDDPDFNASLADLDDGMSDDAQRAKSAPRGSLADLDRGIVDDDPSGAPPSPAITRPGRSGAPSGGG